MGALWTAGQTGHKIVPGDPGDTARFLFASDGHGGGAAPVVNGSVRHYSRRLSIRSMFHDSVQPVAQESNAVDT